MKRLISFGHLRSDSTSSSAPLIAHSPVSPVSPILPNIKTFSSGSNEDVLGDLLKSPTSRTRGESVTESLYSMQLNRRVSSSLPQDYGSLLMTPVGDRPGSVLSSDSISSGTLDLSISDESLVARAKDGSIEAATLEALIDQLIAEFIGM